MEGGREGGREGETSYTHALLSLAFLVHTNMLDTHTTLPSLPSSFPPS
jgi:hypothetical protein